MRSIRVGFLAILLLLAGTALGQRTKIEPGWNLFSAEQDVEIGRTVSKDAERQLRLMRDSQVTSYIGALGRRLASKAPGSRYPYEFRVVDDKAINAFALPGGFLYVNRGIFEAVDNEAQLAGVVAHEIAHVALRHGTNQLTKAYVAQAPFAIIGSLTGSDTIGGMLTQLGASFAANSVLLKFSRDAERDADLLGTQILYDSNYDPRAMAQFFEKLQGSGGSRGVEFLTKGEKPMNRFSYTVAILGLVLGLGGCSADSAEPGAVTPAPAANSAAPAPSAPPAAPAVKANIPAAQPAPAKAVPDKPAAPKLLEIPAGTELSVILIDSLSSESNKAGDPFTATLAAPIMAGGQIVVEKGTKVLGRVVDAESSGRVSGRAQLRLILTSVVDGPNTYPVATKPFVTEAEGTKARDAALLGGAAGIGAAIGGIAGGKSGAGKGAVIGGAAGAATVLATKGKEVEFASESKLKFVLDRPAGLPKIVTR